MVGQYDLQEQPEQDHEQAAADVPRAGQRSNAAQLRQQVDRAHDRHCDKLREEGHEGEIVHQAAPRRELSPFDVDRTAYGLEGVEGYARRQRYQD
jgi:hypothetical protein